MPHADDGQLHAYLDGALPGGLEARRQLEAHVDSCDDCRELLDAARADREGASGVLELLGPSEIEAPPFEQVLARRSREAAAPPVVGAAGSGPSRTRLGSATVVLARAAVILVALGAGWVARGVLNAPPSPGDGAPAAEMVLAEAPEAAAALPADVPAAREPAPEPPVPVAAEPAEAPAAAVALERLVDAADVAAEEEAAPAPARETALDLAQANAPSADEVAGRARAQAAAGVAALGSLAGSTPVWAPSNPADATARLGATLLEIEGLPWSRMEVAEVGGGVLVRTLHPIGDQVVELVQGAAGTGGMANAPVLEEAAAESRQASPTLTGQRDGLDFLLRGADAGTLEQLSDRVR